MRVILFKLLAVSRDDENTRTDFKNPFLKWRHVVISSSIDLVVVFKSHDYT